MDLTQLITVYGPLGIGWVAAVYIGKNYVDLQNRIMQAFIADTAAKGDLTAALSALKEEVARKSGD